MAKLTPDKKADLLIGVDIGGTNLRVGLVNKQGSVLADARRPSQAEKGLAATVSATIEAIKSLLDQQNRKPTDIAGIGLAVPGNHDSKKGLCLTSPNFGGEFPVPVTEPIEKALGLPAFMLNDANTAAFGEHRFGAGRGVDNMVMFTLGTGIGGGAVIDGELRIGPTEGFAEVGHMILDPEGPQCGCGNHGCWEALAGRDAIIERAVRALEYGDDSSLLALCEGNLDKITPALITQAAQDGDALSLDVMEETANWIGIGCINLICLYNPEIIVIGGGIAGALPLILPTIKRTVHARARFVNAGCCQILPSQLASDAGLIGAASLVLKSME